MNPLSDWFVDDRAIVDHQQRLLGEAGYRTLPSGQIDATASRRAAWAWPQWVNREVVAFVESLDAPPRSADAAGRRKRPLLRHVLDRLSRIARRRPPRRDFLADSEHDSASPAAQE